MEVWPAINTGNLRDLSAFDDYQTEFLKLFGFGLPSVDYDSKVDIDIPIPSLQES